MRIHSLCGTVVALIVSVSPVITHAQDLQVIATVSENTIGTEEQVTFTVELSGQSMPSIPTPRPPETERLVILQGAPSTTRNMTIVNGAVKQSVGFSWAFAPTGEGTARLGEVEIVVGGRTYRTEPISVTVVPQSQRPARTSRRSRILDPYLANPGSAEVPEIGEKDIFIRAIPSTRSAFPNQQVTVRYDLYFRNGIQLRQSRLADSWDAEGFWREEFETDARPIPESVVEKGLRYNKIVLKRVAVFPTRAGKLEIDPLKIATEVALPSRGFDPFRSLRGQYQEADVASPRVVVDTKPLPENPPPSFAGAVGRFNVMQAVDPTTVEIGESVELTVNIGGSGNIATLQAPELDLPGAFEVYDPQITANIDRTGTRITGSKTFRYVLVPRSNGTFDIPPVEFSYVDSRTGKYETITSAAARVTVTGDAAALTSTSADGRLPVDDIAGVMAEATKWVKTKRTPLYRSAAAYALIVTPLIALLVVVGLRRRSDFLEANPGLARARTAHPAARRHLRKANRLKESGLATAFYAEVERAVLGFIGNRLNVGERGLTRDQIGALLRKHDVSDEVTAALKELLAECDRVRFSPTTPDPSRLENAYEMASKLIGTLVEELQ